MNWQPGEKFNNSLGISRLKLGNFRCFRELEIDFHDRLTVLVANNGQGKTAILDAIATAFGPFVSAFDEGKDRGLRPDDIHLLRAGNSNRMELADGGATLEAEGKVDFQPTSWKRQFIGPKARTTRKDAQRLTEFGKKLQGQVRREVGDQVAGTCLPLVAYYPTDRLWNVRKHFYKKLSRSSRMVGYTHCLESASDFHLMADWFRYWSINALNQRLKAHQSREAPATLEFENALEVVRTAVNVCLQPSGWGDMDFSVERDEIVARHPRHGELPVGMLSDGIRSVLTLVADIAFRMVKLNPNLGPFAAKSTSGIVLIDEVDMHLHPGWQQTVLASLQEAFPRLQFVVTTHSPQVLSAVPVECIRLVQADEESATGLPVSTVHLFHQQTQGVSSNTVLAEVMGTDPVPDIEQSHQLSQYMALIEQTLQDQPDARALRAKLEAHFGARHPLLLECDRLIRLQSFKAKLADKRMSGGTHGDGN